MLRLVPFLVALGSSLTGAASAKPKVGATRLLWVNVQQSAPSSLLAVVRIGFGGRRQTAEQSMRFVHGTCGEKARDRPPRPPAVSEGQPPKTFDHDGSVMDAFEEATELAVRAERHDGAASEVADQQVAAVLSERVRRQRYAPRRVDFAQFA